MLTVSGVNLDAFAAIWVERWLKYGGGLIADPVQAKISVSMSFDNWRWKSEWPTQRQWHDGWMVGRWRELGDLLDLIPGLREAVVDHVMEHGRPYGSEGWRAMTRVGKHRQRAGPSVLP